MKKTSRIESDIHKLISYCKINGYKVLFKRKTHSWFCPFEKQFVISKDQIPENILYSLLHEIGHFILFRRKSYKEKYGLAATVLDSQIVKTSSQSKRLSKKLSKRLEYRILSIKEELDAWEAGLEFSKKYKIKINKKKWNLIRNYCIEGYCSWVCEPEKAFV